MPIAARHGLPMMSSWVVPDRAHRERPEVYRRVAAEHGHAPAEIETSLARTWTIRFVYVADDERAALADPREHLMGLMGAALMRPRAIPGGEHRTERSYDEHLQSGIAFFGTPDQVVDQVGRFRERTGLDNLLCAMSIRAMDPAKVLRSMELFATRVVPQLA